jgi:hypothetical protein
MAHHIDFFCRTGISRADTAFDVFVQSLSAGATEVETSATGVGIANMSWDIARVRDQEGRAGESISVTFLTGSELLTAVLKQVTGEPGGERVLGTDLLVQLILVGDVDWTLFSDIRSILTDLWSAVPYDETSGFDV